MGCAVVWQLRGLCHGLLPACPARLPAALPPGQGGIETYLTLTQTSARREYYLWAAKALRRLECKDCKDSVVWGGTAPGQGGVWGMLLGAASAWGWGGWAAGQVLPAGFSCAGRDRGGTQGELCWCWVPPMVEKLQIWGFWWDSGRWQQLCTGGTSGQGPDGVQSPVRPQHGGGTLRVAHWAPSCQGWLGHLRVKGQWGCEDRAPRRAGWGSEGAVASPGQPGGWQGPGDTKQEGWQEIPALPGAGEGSASFRGRRGEAEPGQLKTLQ